MKPKHQHSVWNENNVAELRWIEDLKGKHSRKIFWVVATGPSLDDYPEDFFEGKLVIAVKSAYFAFPNSKYGIASAHAGAGMGGWLKHNRYALKNFIVTLRRGHEDALHYFGKQTRDATWMYVHKSRKESNIREAVKTIMTHPIRQFDYPGVDTISHFAIQAAVILGAKKIVLVGCEHRLGEDSKQHAERGGIKEHYENFYQKIGHYPPSDLPDSSFKHQRNGTHWFTQNLKKYGVRVVRHFYGKGYETIT